jgi:hypothetical protein
MACIQQSRGRESFIARGGQVRRRWRTVRPLDGVESSMVGGLEFDVTSSTNQMNVTSFLHFLMSIVNFSMVCERSEREYPWACVCTLRCSVLCSIDFCVRVWVFTRS